jgi:homoserine/homoserine lactone efflux protein
VLFEVMRWTGAAYLIWLGIQAWRHAGAVSAAPAPSGHVHFWRGFAVALSNPKTIAFFTAFLPQFVDPALPAERQLAVMCTVSVVLAAFTDSTWAIAAGLGRAWFMASAAVSGSPWRAGRPRNCVPKLGQNPAPCWDSKNLALTKI